MAKSTQRGSCETCTYYTYDEEYESYMCDVNMDEDEMSIDAINRCVEKIFKTQSGIKICNNLFFK